MSRETKQPFDHKQRRADDSELVEQVLGTQEADEMRALLGDPGPDETPTIQDEGQLAVSEDEQAGVAEVEAETNKERKRQEFIAWAKEFGKDEKYIDRYFEFDNDGIVDIIDGEFLLEEATWLPQGIKECHNKFNLSNSKLTNCDNFPEEVHGNIVLSYSQISNLDGLKRVKIHGSLVLHSIPATSIPRFLEIEKRIYLQPGQKKLIKDAENKGYTVIVMAKQSESGDQPSDEEIRAQNFREDQDSQYWDDYYGEDEDEDEDWDEDDEDTESDEEEDDDDDTPIETSRW